MSKLLENGAKNRTTASTLMNDASSRSHAIFTIFIKQTVYEEKGDAKGKVDESSITAKFFFVDLAGS
jgi:kinesin family protein 4/21/27